MVKPEGVTLLHGVKAPRYLKWCFQKQNYSKVGNIGLKAHLILTEWLYFGINIKRSEKKKKLCVKVAPQLVQERREISWNIRTPGLSHSAHWWFWFIDNKAEVWLVYNYFIKRLPLIHASCLFNYCFRTRSWQSVHAMLYIINKPVLLRVQYFLPPPDAPKSHELGL